MCLQRELDDRAHMKYLHGFVQTICKIGGLVLYAANCKPRGEEIVRSIHCDTLGQSLLSEWSFTNGKKSIFHISRHFLFDNLFNVLIGESDKLLENCG